MGCYASNFKSISVQPIKKHSTGQTKTLSSSKHRFEQDLEFVIEPMCLKISIKDENVEKWEYYIKVIFQYYRLYLPECQLIHELRIEFLSTFSCFEEKIHACCIADYDFFKGLKVFLLYLKTNLWISTNIFAIKSFPFIQIEVKNGEIDSSVIQSWKTIINFMKSIREDPCYEAAYNRIKAVTNVISLNQTKTSRSNSINKSLNWFLKLGHETLSSIKDIEKNLEKFSKNLKKFEITCLNWRNEMSDMGETNIQGLVHRLSSSNYFNT